MPKKAATAEPLDRRKVQDALAEALLGVLPGLGVQDCVEHRRRVCRAMIHIGISFMFDGGDGPELVKKALEEAFTHEVEERHLEAE